MNIIKQIDRILGEDARGKVKAGRVTLDTANDFQRMILNQSYLSVKHIEMGNYVSTALGAKPHDLTQPVTEEDIEKIYKESKKYWKDGGKYVMADGKKTKLQLHFQSRKGSWGYYGSYSWGGWVGSTKLLKKPDQAMKEIEKRLYKVIKEKGSLHGED